jgi:lactate permease
MTWSQDYSPLPHWLLSAIVSALPVLTLFFILLVLKKRVWVSALGGMLMAVLLASVVFHMPVRLISQASLLVLFLDFYASPGSSLPPIFLPHIAVETVSFKS